MHGDPIAAKRLVVRTNYVFSYPYAGTPCFLLDLGRPVAAAQGLLRADGSAYAWNGGVGPARSIVAFSAICAHKLAYPTREVSFIHSRDHLRRAIADALVEAIREALPADLVAAAGRPRGRVLAPVGAPPREVVKAGRFA